MIELKGEARITSIIDDFLEQFGCTSSMWLDFSYYYESHLITWSLLLSDTTDSTFKKFVEMEYPHITADLFLWSLLHELGHHETCEMWTDEEQEEFDRIKEELESEDADCDFSTCCSQYYMIPDEYEATKWAAEYMEEHIEEISELWDKLQEAIMDFYELNEIT